MDECTFMALHQQQQCQSKQIQINKVNKHKISTICYFRLDGNRSVQNQQKINKPELVQSGLLSTSAFVPTHTQTETQIQTHTHTDTHQYSSRITYITLQKKLANLPLYDFHSQQYLIICEVNGRLKTQKCQVQKQKYDSVTGRKIFSIQRLSRTFSIIFKDLSTTTMGSERALLTFSSGVRDRALTKI